jgi:hypothetical protein
MLLPILLVIFPAAVAARCRFALDYACADLQAPAPRAAFLSAYAGAQSAFTADGIGVHGASGLTYDGHPLDYATGAATGAPHEFSAASKECVHAALLALAVRGDALALAALGGLPRALDAAAKKLASYTAFNATAPGYGCMLPWFLVPSMQPCADWATPPRTPALDNGELAFALLALAQALGAAGHAALADGYMAWFSCMARSAPLLFLQPDGSVAAVAVLANASLPPGAQRYAPDGGARLADPFEGETMTVLLDLFAPLSAAQREAMWAKKRANLVATAYAARSAGANITAQAGWWFSAHENWKAALLPYLSVPTAARVLASTERARTHHAADHGWPALLASATDLGNPPPGYVSAAGVRALALDAGAAFRTDLAPPYGAWMVLLHNQSAGACWLRSVLAAPRAQGPLGATEAVAFNGSAISPLATWDTTMTVVLAAAGGVGGLVAEALGGLRAGAPPPARWARAARGAAAGESALARFLARLEGEYAAKFPQVEGEGAGFALPTAAIPQGALAPWPACA